VREEATDAGRQSTMRELTVMMMRFLFWALVTHPWVGSGGCAAGKGWAHPAEVEHCEGDEGFG